MLIRRLLAVCAVSGAGMLVFLPARGSDPTPAGNPVPASKCEKACEDAQEKTDENCSGIKDEAARDKCHMAAYEEAKRCKAACKKGDDCLEHCKDLCYQAWEKCRDDCPRGDKNCMNECSQEHGRCIKKCEEKCKK